MPTNMACSAENVQPCYHQERPAYPMEKSSDGSRVRSGAIIQPFPTAKARDAKHRISSYKMRYRSNNYFTSLASDLQVSS